MTISVTVNGDFTLDETVDLQNSSLPAEAPAEDKNDEDVLYASLHQDLKDLVAAMGLTDSFPDSAPATVGSRAAKSQTNLITVTSDGNLTDISLTGAYDDKGNADPSDDTVTPLNVYDPVAENFGDGGATGLTTTDGNAILLYSDVDNSGTGFAEAAGLTGNVVFGIEDTTGDIVFIIFMEETDLGVVAGLDTTQLQFSMLTFEAIQHDTAGTTVAAHDDSVNLGDFLSLSVGETTKFDFSNAPAGKSLFLMAQDSNNGTAVVVTSDALEVQINTSKAQETTIGWGSQGINAGETVVLTFVSGGLDSNFVIPNLDQNEADVAGNIVFDNPVPVDSGSFEIAQKVGSATAAIRLRAYDGSTVTDGAAFFNDTGGTEVDFASITVNNPDGTLRLAWTGGPDVTGNGLTINILTLAEAAATPDPDDQEGDIVITGLNEGDVILYEADGTMSRLWVTGVSGNVDIGAISVNEAGGGIAPIGDAFTIEDAGPTAAISLTGTTVVHDESAGVQNGGPNIPGVEDNNDDDQAGAVPGAIALFETDESLAARLGWAQSSGAVVDTSATDFGADGERDADGEGGDPPDGIDLELLLSAEGADSGLTVLGGMGISLYTQTVTVASEDITLVVGRVNSVDTTEPIDPRGDPDPTGEVAFVLYLNDDGLLSTAQYLELQNPDGTDPDDQVQIQSGVLFVQVTATDRDGDSDTALVDLGDDPATIPGEDGTSADPEISANNEGVVRFEDDGPTGVAGSGPTTIEEEDLNNAQSVGIDDDSSVVNFTATKKMASLVTDPGVDKPLVFGIIDLADDAALAAKIADVTSSLNTLSGLTSKGAALNYHLDQSQVAVVNSDPDSSRAALSGATVLAAGTYTLEIDADGLDGISPVTETVSFTADGAVDDLDDLLTAINGSVVATAAIDADGDLVITSVSNQPIILTGFEPISDVLTDGEHIQELNSIVATAVSVSSDPDNTRAALGVSDVLTAGTYTLRVDADGGGGFGAGETVSLTADGSTETLGDLMDAINASGLANAWIVDGDLVLESVSGQPIDLTGFTAISTALTDGEHDTTRTVFTWQLRADGLMTYTQEDQFDHPAGNGANSLTLDFDDLLDIADADGDAISLPGEAEYNVEDDVPELGTIDNLLVDFASGDTDTVLLLDPGHPPPEAVGADEEPTYRIISYTGDAADVLANGPVVINGVTLTAQLSADELMVTYYHDGGTPGAFDGGVEDTLYYTYSLIDDVGDDGIIDSAQFAVHLNPPPPTLEFDLSELPSGSNLFGILAGKSPGETTVDPDGAALIILGRDAGDTINTSKGGGPTTIGNSNQMIDGISSKHPTGEGVYFVYVEDPEDDFVSGIPGGLDQNEADVAGNIQYDGGMIEVDGAFFEISQVQGNSLVTLRITAFDSPAGTGLGEGAEGQTLVDDPTQGGSTVNVSAVRVFDGDTLIYEETELGGVTGGLSGIGTIDVVYSGDTAEVYGLDDGLRIEFDTDAVHDTSLIEGMDGKFDIGGFGISEPTPTPDQVFEFEVEMSDYDGDTDTATHFAGIDGTGVNDDDSVAWPI